MPNNPPANRFMEAAIEKTRGRILAVFRDAPRVKVMLTERARRGGDDDA